MTLINVTTGKSYNFKAPEGDVGVLINEVPFPMVDLQAVADAATIAIAVKAQITVATIEELGAAATINITPASDLVAGAVLILVIVNGSTPRNATLSGNIADTVIIGAANTTKKVVLIYDGAEFIAVNPAIEQQDLAAYTADNESAAYTATPAALTDGATLADANHLRVAYENLRAYVEDMAAKLIASGVLKA